MQNEAWRRRPMVVTTLDRCDECETLQPDVKKRVNYWPSFVAVCCGECYSKRIAEFYDLSAT